MQRRSFLSLLVGTSALVVADRILPVEEALPPPIIIPYNAAVKRYILPLTSDIGNVLPAGRVAIFSGLPQKIFRPNRLILGAATMGDYEGLEVLNVSSAGEPQTEGSIPASVFAPLGFNVDMQFGASRPGEQIVLAILNNRRTSVDFRAAMIGDSVG